MAKNLIQSHLVLYHRYKSMAWAIRKKTPDSKLSDDERKAANDLEEQAEEHYRKWQLQSNRKNHNATFVMVVR